jgi:sialate O-acetylesterase
MLHPGIKTLFFCRGISLHSNSTLASKERSMTARRAPVGILVLFCFAAASRAADSEKPFVHPLFADDMVLQRDMEDPIWGWTEPGKQVTVSMNGKTATATADSDGKWIAKIGPFEAGGPFELTISGPETVKLTNVLVGDVWICSGQSNMEMGIANAFDREHEVAAANYPQLRLFTVPKHVASEPQTQFGKSRNQPEEAKWLPCTPKNIMVGDWAGFSAVAYFFGRDLQEHLKIPIGLIHTSWGGTIAEAWVSGPSLKQMPDFKDAVEKIEQTGGKPATSQPRRQGPNPNVPTVLYNGMIAPLGPLAIKGAIWYQGESNAGRAKQYRTLLPTLIRDWREHFTGGEFPFFIVQLAAFMPVSRDPQESQWAELRDAQTFTAQTAGHSALAIAYDLGNTTDIHPKNKQEVGYRLALDARAIAYGEDVEYSGPVYKDMEVKDDSIVLHFDHLGGGLAGGSRGFAVAGEDGKFVWANSKVVGDTVVVSSPKVEHPVAVRYAWSNNPDEANLYNKAGLPAVPFSTNEKKAEQGK